MKCQRCGHDDALISTSDELEHVLAQRSGRGVYLGRDGNYYIEYSGGQVDGTAIISALAEHRIEPKWREHPEGYWVLTARLRAGK